ncbi:MAG: PilZ domain-containing protein [Myxococcales bacterium]|nr:PilZ domain-containing protein [Myxococcales bacterium]
MDDRRNDSRFRAVELKIGLLLDDGERGVESRDISKGGVCFTHCARLPLGERRRLRLMLDLGQDRFSEPLEIEARVVWCTELSPDRFQVGAAFDALDGVHAQALQQLLYLLSREVSEDERGRLRFRTALVPAIDPSRE